jgi:hypothetical protein
MGSKIGYPKKILNITQLDLDYEEVCVHTEAFVWSGVIPLMFSFFFFFLACLFLIEATN